MMSGSAAWPRLVRTSTTLSASTLSTTRPFAQSGGVLRALTPSVPFIGWSLGSHGVRMVTGRGGNSRSGEGCQEEPRFLRKSRPMVAEFVRIRSVGREKAEFSPFGYEPNENASASPRRYGRHWIRTSDFHRVRMAL